MDEAILAALKGHIRAAMWKLCLSPAGLLGIFSDTTDAICLLGASPAGNLARPQERSYYPDMWSQLSLSSNRTRDDDSGRSLLVDGQFTRVRRGNRIAHENPMNSSESLHGEKIDDYDGLLHIAAFEGDIKLIRLLLDKGADINSGGKRFGSALQAASYAGRLHVVRELMDNGADINAQGGSYRNAVMAALRRGHVEVVQLLLDNGAAFGDQLAVPCNDNESASATLPRHVDQGVEPGASIHHASVDLETDPVPISIAGSSAAEPDSVSARSDDQERGAMPGQPDNTLGSPHHQDVTSGTVSIGEQQLDTSQATGDHELCVGEILNADGVPHVLRLLECTSGAIRLEGRPLNSTTESLPSWTVYLTTALHIASDLDFFLLESKSIVSMARPNPGIFYSGSEHRLSKNLNGCCVLPFRRREGKTLNNASCNLQDHVH